MKQNLKRIAYWTLLFATFASTAAAHPRSCSLAGVAGSYGYTISGTIGGLGPVAAVGNVNVDSSGNLNGAQTTDFNGTIVPETLSGTATVNSNCTGTVTVNVFESGALVRTDYLNLVFDNNQRHLRGIFLTAGTVLTISGEKTFPDESD